MPIVIFDLFVNLPKISYFVFMTTKFNLFSIIRNLNTIKNFYIGNKITTTIIAVVIILPIFLFLVVPIVVIIPIIIPAPLITFFVVLLDEIVKLIFVYFMSTLKCLILLSNIILTIKNKHNLNVN